MTYKSDRRDNERRRVKEHVEFPFKDNGGKLVTCDRRKKADRRTKVLVTSETISDAEFDEYYKK